MPDPSTRQPNNDVFVLGAGFSKAAHAGMPLMTDLNQIISETYAADGLFAADRLHPFVQNGNFEVLLSYLGSDAPWKNPSESWGDKALFHRIAETIADEIMSRETAGITPSSIPHWLQKLVIYFDWYLTTVITFNYDTIVERSAWLPKVFDGEKRSYARSIQSAHLYPPIMQDIRVSNPRARLGDPQGRQTFRLIKLHGSINWFYSGTDVFPGEQVYFAETQKNNPRDDYQIIEPYVQTKQRLIIPPVSEKSAFYSNFLVRALWKGARDALTKARRVFFIGYSLPETDLTTRQLLLSSVPGDAEIFIVSEGDRNDPKKKALVELYRKAMPQVARGNVKDDYIREECLRHLAWDLLGTDPHAYNQYAMPIRDEELARLWQER